LRKVISGITKALGLMLVFLIAQALVNSSLDIYNNFAYDKAILRSTPYGYVPLLQDPNNYQGAEEKVKGGDFVYVENWESVNNGKIVFAKVRSKLNSGYVNNKMLVEANINIMPIFSVLMLGLMLIYSLRKIYQKLIL
jgi:hypothetical protein